MKNKEYYLDALASSTHISELYLKELKGVVVKKSKEVKIKTKTTQSK